ncbi:MAG: hypothetical protein JWM59_3594 [Verrucomicrobiales bacterium]|nr:hypothetical protein [Verrucomicrobiales bacterium]
MTGMSAGPATVRPMVNAGEAARRRSVHAGRGSPAAPAPTVRCQSQAQSVRARKLNGTTSGPSPGAGASSATAAMPAARSAAMAQTAPGGRTKGAEAGMVWLESWTGGEIDRPEWPAFKRRGPWGKHFRGPDGVRSLHGWRAPQQPRYWLWGCPSAPGKPRTSKAVDRSVKKA